MGRIQHPLRFRSHTEVLINGVTTAIDVALARVTYGLVPACSPKEVNKQLKLKYFPSNGTLMKMNDFNVRLTPVKKAGS